MKTRTLSSFLLALATLTVVAPVAYYVGSVDGYNKALTDLFPEEGVIYVSFPQTTSHPPPCVVGEVLVVRIHQLGPGNTILNRNEDYCELDSLRRVEWDFFPNDSPKAKILQ